MLNVWRTSCGKAKVNASFIADCLWRGEHRQFTCFSSSWWCHPPQDRCRFKDDSSSRWATSVAVGIWPAEVEACRTNNTLPASRQRVALYRFKSEMALLHVWSRGLGLQLKKTRFVQFVSVVTVHSFKKNKLMSQQIKFIKAFSKKMKDKHTHKHTYT